MFRILPDIFEPINYRKKKVEDYNKYLKYLFEGVLDDNLVVSLKNIENKFYVYFLSEKKFHYFAYLEKDIVYIKKIKENELFKYSVENTILEELIFNDEESA